MQGSKGPRLEFVRDLIQKKESAIKASDELHEVVQIENNVSPRLRTHLKLLKKQEKRILEKEIERSKKAKILDPETKVLSAKPPTLKEAQDFVGGYVQMISLGKGRQMIVNEEAYILPVELKHNPEATEIAKRGSAIIGPRGILGNALILTGAALWK